MLLNLCVNCLKKGVICATFNGSFQMLVNRLKYFFETCFECMQKSVIGGQSEERPKRLSSWSYWPSRIRS